MKKCLNYILILFVFMFIGVMNIKAASLDLSVNEKNKSITATVKGGNGYILSYASGGVSCSGGNISSNPYGRALTADEQTINCTYTTSDYASYAFSLIKDDGSTSPEISKNVEVNVSKKTTTTTTTTAAPTTTTSAKSNNANLSSLSVTTSSGDKIDISPAFSKDTLAYDASVASNVKTIVITGTMEDSKASMVLSKNASEELVAGETTKITITVTAEDGSKKTYTLNVAREALTADAKLKSLSIAEYKGFKLQDDIYEYTITIKKSVKKLTLDYVTSDEKATVSVEGNENLEDGSKVKIIVTAEDESSKNEYTLNIIMEETTTKVNTSVSAEKNPLVIMTLSIIAFGLIGGIIYVIRK